MFDLKKNPAAIIPLTKLDESEDKLNYLLASGGGTAGLIGTLRTVEKYTDTVKERDAAKAQIQADAQYTRAGRLIVSAARDHLRVEGSVAEITDQLVTKINDSDDDKPKPNESEEATEDTNTVEVVNVEGKQIKTAALGSFLINLFSQFDMAVTEDNKITAKQRSSPRVQKIPDLVAETVGKFGG